MDISELLRKTWHFIWEEDSLASWIVNIILAFVIIKFIVYPGLGFVLSTKYPIVAVVSGSMEHDGAFGKWWEKQENFYKDIGITKQEFIEFSFRNGFNTGDIMVLKGVSYGNIKIGDVIVFRASKPEPIIHRVIAVNKDGSLQTKGDHNIGSNYDEKSIGNGQIIGKAWLRVPWLGWVKIIFVNTLKLAGVMK